MDEIKIVKMEFPDEKGGISLTARSPAFAAFAEECVKMFKEDGGVNYVEWRMTAGEPGFGIFTVCIQREAGETPAQQNGRLRKELEVANLQVGEQTQDIEFYRALILRVYCTHKPEVQDTNCNRCQMTWRDNLRAQGNLYLRPALKPLQEPSKCAAATDGHRFNQWGSCMRCGVKRKDEFFHSPGHNCPTCDAARKASE